MARKKPPEAGVPEWILTYGDMMSLLLCFFIMLFSMSIIAEIKWEAVVESLQRELGYAGSSRQKSTSTKTTPARSSTTERSRRTSSLTGGQPIVATQGNNLKVQTIRIEARDVKGGFIRFPIGDDELMESEKKSLLAMKDQLLGSPFKILIKGHVAPNEEGKGLYRRDIDLAYARAVKVMDYLISIGFKQEFFQIEVVDSSEMPNRAILPPGTNPKQAGASAEVFLIDKTKRDLQGN
ncbi:MotB [Planctomycetales bacterium]|nr:MotB [Planctomycetales bacterium]